MTYVFSIIGTALAALFIFQLLKGKKYISLVENLDGGKYPLHNLFIAGFAWSQSGTIKLRGRFGADLKTYAGLLYEQRYAEYYANLSWAQAITYCHLFLAVTFLLAAILRSSAGLILIAGICLSAFSALYSLNDLKNTIDKRTASCEAKLPEVVSTMAILVNSGMVLRDAWQTISQSGSGEIYDLMRAATERMRNGYSDADAIYLFGQDTHSTEVKKFTSTLIQNLERGGTDLSGFLIEQSSELWNGKRQKMLQEGEKASGKLLAPTVLIFFGILIIVFAGAFTGIFA